MKAITIATAALCLACAAHAQIDSATQKYSLFKPVPKAQMREMATDRPDVTENAYTLDAGHFQIETDLFKTARNEQNGTTSIENFYNLANIKLGITRSADFQLVVNSYAETLSNPKTSKSGSAFNDLTFRVKQNLWGNNNGKTALSIMPYLNIPLRGDKRLDGGVILPFAASLKNNWNMGAQAALAIVKNETDRKFHTEILNSVTFNHELAKNLEGFAEAFYNYSFADKSMSIYADSGLIFSLSDNLKLDAGLNYGITKDTDKVYFVGFSFRY